MPPAHLCASASAPALALARCIALPTACNYCPPTTHHPPMRLRLRPCLGLSQVHGVGHRLLLLLGLPLRQQLSLQDLAGQRLLLSLSAHGVVRVCMRLYVYTWGCTQKILLVSACFSACV